MASEYNEQQNSSVSFGEISFLQLSDSFRTKTRKLCDPEQEWVSTFIKWGKLIRWPVRYFLNGKSYQSVTFPTVAKISSGKLKMQWEGMA